MSFTDSVTNAGSTRLIRVHLRDVDTYQMLAHETAQYPGKDDPGEWAGILYPVVKLNGEAGEVAELVGKAYRSQHPVDREKLQLELGDVLWYISEIAWQHGLALSDVAEANLVKLAERYSTNRIKEHPDESESEFVY